MLLPSEGEPVATKTLQPGIVTGYDPKEKKHDVLMDTGSAMRLPLFGCSEQAKAHVWTYQETATFQPRAKVAAIAISVA